MSKAIPPPPSYTEVPDGLVPYATRTPNQISPTSSHTRPRRPFVPCVAPSNMVFLTDSARSTGSSSRQFKRFIRPYVPPTSLDSSSDSRSEDNAGGFKEGGPSLSPQLESKNHPGLKRQVSRSATGSTKPKKAMKVEKTGAKPSAHVTQPSATASASSSPEVPKAAVDNEGLNFDQLLLLSHRERQLAYDNATRRIVEANWTNLGEFYSIVKMISRTERELGRIEGLEERRIGDRQDVEIIEISDEDDERF